MKLVSINPQVPCQMVTTDIIAVSADSRHFVTQHLGVSRRFLNSFMSSSTCSHDNFSCFQGCLFKFNGQRSVHPKCIQIPLLLPAAIVEELELLCSSKVRQFRNWTRKFHSNAWICGIHCYSCRFTLALTATRLAALTTQRLLYLLTYLLHGAESFLRS